MTTGAAFPPVRQWSRSMSGAKLVPLMRRLKNALPLMIDLGLVFFLFGLDMRDLYYKIAWIGPRDTFSFYAISTRSMDPNVLVVAPAFAYPANSTLWTNVSDDTQRDAVSIAATPRQSGWLPLTSRCEEARTAGTGMVFVGVLGSNCSIGPPGHTTTVPELYMSGSVRPDSMAWAACKLLYEHRKPPLCSANAVTGFLHRYGFEDRVVTRDMLALPYTAAEAELLALLLVVSKSFPLHQMTCVEGYASAGPGVYHTTLFGCGSPNVLESAILGIHATNFAYLHRDKAWLTVDTINVMGFTYTMRQNCISEFTITADATTGAMLQTPKTVANFSSSGVLYTTVIVVDVVLMLVHLWSALEIARLVFIPLVQTHLRAKQGDDCEDLAQDYQTVFTCSLYRSRPIVIMTLITQLLSWIIILPNSIIWTWSTSSKMTKVQAYFSSLRLWVLILVVVNEAWDLVVVLHEPFAYSVSKDTYVSSLEIIAIGAVVSYVQRKTLFAVTDTKYAMEKQRNKDLTSYAKKIAFTNAFNEQNDHYLSTPVDVLAVVYAPLLSIILWSLLCIVGVLVLRFVSYKFFAAGLQWYRRRRQISVSDSVNTAGATKISVVAAIQQRRDNSQHPASQLLGPTPVSPLEHHAELYKRVPLEELLNVPIRARCLVRSGLEIESETINKETNARETFIRPPFFLEHGVVIDRGTMRSRRGFFHFVQPRVDFKEYVIPAQSNAFEIAQLRRQLHEGKALFPLMEGVVPSKPKGT